MGQLVATAGLPGRRLRQLEYSVAVRSPFQCFHVLPINPASQPNSRFQGLRVPGCRALGPGKRTEHQPQTRRLKPNSDCCITYYVILFLSKYYLSAWHPSAQFEEHSSHPKYSLRGTSQHFMVLPPTLFQYAMHFTLGYFADLCRTCVLVENILKWNTFSRIVTHKFVMYEILCWMGTLVWFRLEGCLGCGCWSLHGPRLSLSIKHGKQGHPLVRSVELGLTAASTHHPG